MANWDYIFGDTIAAGLAVSKGLSRTLTTTDKSSKDEKGQSRPGAKPKEVLSYLKGFGAAAFDGKVVVLSTGYTFDADKDTIKEQLQFLKDSNAAVMIVGVCGATKDTKGKDLSKEVLEKKIADGNDWLSQASISYRQTFSGGFFKTDDGLVPVDYTAFWGIFESKLPLANTPLGTQSNSGSVTPKDSAAGSGEIKTERPPDPPRVPLTDPFAVYGKIVLKKVSGPGEIVGVVEQEISTLNVNRGVLFEDISFTVEGDYEVSVTSDHPDIEPLTFKVSVGKESEFVEQDAGEEVKNEDVKGGRPCIAQVEKTNVKIPPMILPASEDNHLNEQVVNSVSVNPFMQFSSATIQHTDIQIMKLYHDGIIPKCSVTFKDSTGIMKTNTAQDNTTFAVFIDSKTPDLKFIHLVFKIESFKQIESTNSYSMLGVLHIPDTDDYLYLQNYESFTGNSVEALMYLSKKMGLGFNTNIDKADDTMNWVFNGSKTFEVINSIIKHSYVSEKSFMWGYIDYYYCMNYVDIEKELARDITQDVGVETGSGKGAVTNVKMGLINDPSVGQSCFYFDSFDVKNNSTQQSLNTGYRTRVKYYDLNTKQMLEFDVDGNTSDQSDNLILKGPVYDTGVYDKNVRTEYKGMIDTSNVHKNYYYAPALNKRNIDDLQKISMTINMPQVNLNVYKGMKVSVEVLNLAPNVQEPEKVLYRYSGNWIVSDIVYLFETGKFYQKMILVRRELGKKPEETVEPIAKKEDKPEETVNPEPIKFNEEYVVGETYAFVSEEDGQTYFVVVNSKSDDGATISGTIKRKQEVEPISYGDEYDMLDEEYIEQQVEIDVERESPSFITDPDDSFSKIEDSGSNLVNDTNAPGGNVLLPTGRSAYSHNSTQGYNLVDSKWYGSLVRSAKAHIDHPTFDVPGTGNGAKGCASWVSMVFYRAFGVNMADGKPVKPVPKSIGDFGSTGTAALNGYFINNPTLWQKVNWTDGQPGDIINTAKAKTYGHIGIVIDEVAPDGTYYICSNSSSGFGSSKDPQGCGRKNFTIKSWKSVTNRNPSGTSCWRYIGPKLASGTNA